MHQNFLSSWNTFRPNGNDVCVHGFLDNTGFYQTLPWTMKGWHAGGSANSSLIGFEICEPKSYADKTYFETVKNYAIELCVMLCKKFGFGAEAITTHCEGYQRYGGSYASNHSDIHHWWKVYHNYTIDDFRKDVKKELERKDNMVFNSGNDALNYLVEKGRVTDKEYWEKVLDTTNKTEYLFMKWAEDYSKLVGE
jgi:N-acetylmuramoyl-L-alanine amidase CwlA